MNGALNLVGKFNKFKNKKYRHAYLKAHTRVGIASQIHLLRNKLNINQSQLAEIIGTKQSVISRLEDPDYGSVNLNTLLKIAEAFDVGLLVKFVTFGKFFRESQDVSPDAISVNNYTEELENIMIQTDLSANNVEEESQHFKTVAEPIASDNVVNLKDYITARTNHCQIHQQIAEAVS